MTAKRPTTRIQRKNTATILDAALEVFSAQGFAGATLDQIARQAGLSKPNLLYYFASKEAIYVTLLTDLMETWLAPLRALDPEGEPVDEIVGYVLRKLDMSRRFPRESRLFANEVLSGAPHFSARIDGELRALVDEKAALIAAWQAEGRLAALDPRHLIFSIWATTQHYADFDVQVRGVLGTEGDGHYRAAEAFLGRLYRGALAP
ncbi:TetR family transcriptional regulator [Rhodobacteraceae bacterium CCMM004]|nr:TetR family transcriptional regulator [Rhodobacteraceae bacterium CCMM004]